VGCGNRSWFSAPRCKKLCNFRANLHKVDQVHVLPADGGETRDRECHKTDVPTGEALRIMGEAEEVQSGVDGNVLFCNGNQAAKGFEVRERALLL
jgi:hypothetical protein